MFTKTENFFLSLLVRLLEALGYWKDDKPTKDKFV